MNYLFYILFSAWNIIVMLVYAIDKIKAKRGTRRIREATLLTLSFLAGSFGAMFGMVLFNHKTAKMKFRILVPLMVLFHIAVFVFVKQHINFSSDLFLL